MNNPIPVTNSEESGHAKLFPILLFIVSIAATLPIGLLENRHARRTTQTTTVLLQNLEKHQEDALEKLREYSQYSLQQADSEKGDKAERENKLHEAEAQALEAKKLTEQERERQESLPLKPKPWTSDVPIIMQVVVSLVLLSATLFVVLSKKYDAKDKHWAYATVGLIIGFWLRT